MHLKHVKDPSSDRGTGKIFQPEHFHDELHFQFTFLEQKSYSSDSFEPSFK